MGLQMNLKSKKGATKNEAIFIFLTGSEMQGPCKQDLGSELSVDVSVKIIGIRCTKNNY